MQMHVQIVQQGMNNTVAAIYICCRSWRLYQLLRPTRGGEGCCVVPYAGMKATSSTLPDSFADWNAWFVLDVDCGVFVGSGHSC
jgi:hypothetical protein